MPNWLTNPLIKADSIDQPSLTRSPARAQLEGFLGGALEAASSPADIGMTLLPYGLGRAAKALPAALRGLRGASQAVGQAAESPLDEMVRLTQTGPVGPKAPTAKLPNRWELGVQPKSGGVLDEVLTRGAEKAGSGASPTPGEAGLMRQFLQYPTPRR